MRQALDMAGAALAEGRAVPREALTLIAKNPIPGAPFAVWRWIFVAAGSREWHRRAAANGVSKARMVDRLYAA